MQVGKEDPGVIDQVKQLVGASLYPCYAERSNVAERIWSWCEEVTGERMTDTTSENTN